MASSNPNAVALLLGKQLKALTTHPVPGFKVELVQEGNIYQWRVWIRGLRGTPYEGGVFAARLEFPPDFPFMPPAMRFESAFWHPNVYPDGRVCVSILHPPEDDRFGYELASERWSPVQTVESVLLSVLSMLGDPNDESPANVEAAMEWRRQPEEYARHCQRISKQSLASLPPGFVPPMDPEDECAKAAPPQDFSYSVDSVDMEYEEEENVDDDDDEGDNEGANSRRSSSSTSSTSLAEAKAQFSRQLRELSDMGFTDVRRCVAALQRARGEVERACELLLQSNNSK